MTYYSEQIKGVIKIGGDDITAAPNATKHYSTTMYYVVLRKKGDRTFEHYPPVAWIYGTQLSQPALSVILRTIGVKKLGPPRYCLQIYLYRSGYLVPFSSIDGV